MPLRTTFATPSLSSRFYFFSFDICKYKQTPQALMAYSEKKKCFQKWATIAVQWQKEWHPAHQRHHLKKFQSMYLHLNLATYSHCNPGSWTKMWSVQGKLEIISLRLCPSHILMQWKKLPRKHSAESSEQCMQRLLSGSTRVSDI